MNYVVFVTGQTEDTLRDVLEIAVAEDKGELTRSTVEPGFYEVCLGERNYFVRIFNNKICIPYYKLFRFKHVFRELEVPCVRYNVNFSERDLLKKESELEKRFLVS